MKRPASVPASPTRRQLEILLQPGEYCVGDASHRIRTVLGSCVSVTLWCPARRVGAMSHFLLASRGDAVRGQLDARYGDEALPLMLRDLAARQVSGASCQAKIFGGGDMFPGRKARGPLSVGRRNGEAARDLLQSQGIEVVSEHLFGDGHRQIVFDIESGHVWSRQVPPESAAAQPKLKRAIA